MTVADLGWMLDEHARLGLAIQTGSPASPAVALLFEIVAWALLLASGIAGLSRLAWQRQLFQVMGVTATYEDQVSALAKGILEAREEALGHGVFVYMLRFENAVTCLGEEESRCFGGGAKRRTRRKTLR